MPTEKQKVANTDAISYRVTLQNHITNKRLQTQMQFHTKFIDERTTPCNTRGCSKLHINSFNSSQTHNITVFTNISQHTSQLLSNFTLRINESKNQAADSKKTRGGRRWWKAVAAVRETEEQRLSSRGGEARSSLQFWEQMGLDDSEKWAEGRRGELGDGFAREKRRRWGICLPSSCKGWFTEDGFAADGLQKMGEMGSLLSNKRQKPKSQIFELQGRWVDGFCKNKEVKQRRRRWVAICWSEKRWQKAYR